jgi:hypothetical protein
MFYLGTQFYFIVGMGVLHVTDKWFALKDFILI